MKIRRLYIKDYQQFKDVALNFVYPEGHPKAGQFMDKVCFIGQSGTGKTTLLDLLDEFGSKFPLFQALPSGLEFTVEDMLNGQGKSKPMTVWAEKEHGAEDEPIHGTFHKNHENIVVFLKANLVGNSNLLYEKKAIENGNNGIVTDAELKDKEAKKENVKLAEYKRIESRKYIHFSAQASEDIWNYLMKEIDEYDEEISQKGIEIMRTNSFADLEKLKEEIEKWKKKMPNPRIDLAEKCLNPILNKFNLKVNTNAVKTPIVVQGLLEEKDIPAHGLSTGTKQFIQTAIPLYQLNTDGALLLIDEPERSLFPDIQLELIDYYKSLSPKSQLFVATHSPIIAASFEPCERFILYFDNEGEVQIRNGAAPKGDDPNDLLFADFRVNILNKYGMEKWGRYLKVKRLLKSSKEDAEKKALLQEYRELGDLYNFEA